jgi:ankyrin repeat protein
LNQTLRGVAGLHLSAWRNCAAVAELLLDAGADIELPDEVRGLQFTL